MKEESKPGPARESYASFYARACRDNGGEGIKKRAYLFLRYFSTSPTTFFTAPSELRTLRHYAGYENEYNE